jgi:3-hydroxyacyl-[acyl-carrier-protein] dehydratase
MPPQFIVDLSQIDLNTVLFDQEVIRTINPQRGDMEHLDAIIWVDPVRGMIVGKKIVREDEFWIPGHIPGRPLLPGVLMIEAGAQLAGFYTKKYVGWEGFIGFGGTGETKFRAQVKPGSILYLMAQQTWSRHRRIGSKVQGVVDGALAFETEIIGTQM